MNPLSLLCLLACLAICACKSTGQNKPSECEDKTDNCAADDQQPQEILPPPSPPSRPAVQQLDLQSKAVDTTFALGISAEIDRIEVHDQHSNAVEAVIAVWPSRANQNIYALQGITSAAELFFLAGAESKNINAIVGFKADTKVFTARVRVIANAATEITMMAHLYSESAAGIGPYSTRFMFSQHPEGKRTRTPRRDEDKPLEFIAIDEQGNTLWLANTQDEQTRIADGVVSIIKHQTHTWYRPLRKDCHLQQPVFARVENKIFRATCEAQLPQ